MSIREKFEAERQRHEETEKDALHGQINDLKAQKGQLETLLHALESGYQTAAGSAKQIKADQLDLKTLFEQNKDILEGQSYEDFLQANTDEQEVVQLKTHRERLKSNVRSLRETKHEIQKTIPDLKGFTGGRPKGADKRTSTQRERAIQTIRQHLTDLDHKMIKLTNKTPEGQAAIIQQRTESLLDAHHGSARYPTFDEFDIQRAKEWGKDFVLSTVTEDLRKKIETRMADVPRDQWSSADKESEHNLSERVALAWDKAEREAMLKENRAIQHNANFFESEMKEYSAIRQDIERLQQDIARFRTQFSSLLDSRVAVDKDYRNDRRTRVTLSLVTPEVAKERENIAEVEKTLKQATADVNANQRLDRKFWNQTKIDTELQNLENQVAGLKSQLRGANTRLETAEREAQEKAVRLSNICNNDKTKELAQYVLQQSGRGETVESLLGLVERYLQTLKPKTSPEQQQLFEKFLELEKSIAERRSLE